VGVFGPVTECFGEGEVRFYGSIEVAVRGLYECCGAVSILIDGESLPVAEVSSLARLFSSVRGMSPKILVLCGAGNYCELRRLSLPYTIIHPAQDTLEKAAELLVGKVTEEIPYAWCCPVE
jgi:hypothetical protein